MLSVGWVISWALTTINIFHMTFVEVHFLLCWCRMSEVGIYTHLRIYQDVALYPCRFFPAGSSPACSSQAIQGHSRQVWCGQVHSVHISTLQLGGSGGMPHPPQKIFDCFWDYFWPDDRVSHVWKSSHRIIEYHCESRVTENHYKSLYVTVSHYVTVS